MTLAGGRRIVCAEGEFEWVVGRRGGGDFRVVVQDALRRGQLLIVLEPVYRLWEQNESWGDYYLRSRIDSDLLRQFIAEGLRRGWRPEAKGVPPFRLGAPSATIEFDCGIALLDALWSVLDAVRSDAAWRERLARNTGEFEPIPPEFPRAVDPALPDRLAAAGRWVIHVRPRDYHGDASLFLAIRSLTWNRDVMLMEFDE